MDTERKEFIQNRKVNNSEKNKHLSFEQSDQKVSKGKFTKFLDKFYEYSENRTYRIIFSNFVLFLAVLFYLITLKGCDLESQAECLKTFDQTTIKYYVYFLVTSAFCFSLIFNLTVYKKIHFITSIYTTAIIWYLCYVHDTGEDLKNHGAYNRVFLFVLILITFILQNFIVLIYKMTNKIGFIKGGLSLTILLIIAAISLHFKLKSSCNQWRKGLGNSEIDNTVEGCQIKEPSYCWMNLMDNMFDVSGWMGETCEQIRMDNYDQVIKWTRVKGASRLGFPRFEKWRYFPDSTLDEFQFRLLGGMIDMDNPRVPKEIKDKTEVIIDFSKPHPEMIMRAARDEKLAAQRTKARASYKNTKFIAKNVIHLFIDSLSRDNFKRKLPKTRAFLNKLYKNKNSEARSYQFLKYHALASWTYINMVPTIFGVDGSFNGSPTSKTKYLKDRGFITALATNYCSREFFDIENGNIRNFNFEGFDHEVIVGCDANYSIPGHPFALFNGPYGIKRRCLYGKDSSWYITDYAKKFWKAYPNEPKFLRTSFIDAHEGTGEVVKYLDDKIIDFLEFLEAEGSLKDTVIMIQADHGVNMPGFYTFVDAEDFWIEKTLPANFLIVPQEVANEYDEILSEKENVMLSPYDIHNTFLHLAGAPKMAFNDIGKSYFAKTDDIHLRSCDRFRVIDPYCVCLGKRDS